jgi:3(or 17)beta-hydroxysteroid dehydrogenase
MARLAGKVALVTGGASGMGAATVRRFVAEGARVISTDVQEGLGAEVAKAAGARFLTQDVADEAGWVRVMEYIEAEYGRLDVVMNNAGIMSGRSIGTVDLASWNRTIGINLTGVMLGCHHGIALMRRNPGGSSGSIINISSTTAYAALADDVAYSASKSGVRILSKSVAGWCARERLNIRCNSIHPGPIMTGIIQASLDAAPDPAAALAQLNRMAPLGRIGTGEEIAAMAVFLASDEASYCTGGEYLVDGGTLALHPGM